MSTDKQALAARAVACKGWRWMPGMLDELGGRVLKSDAGYLAVATVGGGTRHYSAGCWLPDLDDVTTAMAIIGVALESQDKQAHPATMARLSEAAVAVLDGGDPQLLIDALRVAFALEAAP